MGVYKGGTFVVPGGTGNYSVTGVGFEPSAVFFIGSNQTLEDQVVTGNNLAMFMGVMYPHWDTKAMTCVAHTFAAEQWSRSRVDACILGGQSQTVDEFRAAPVSFDADGFTVNFDIVGSGRVYWLAFSGPVVGYHEYDGGSGSMTLDLIPRSNMWLGYRVSSGGNISNWPYHSQSIGFLGGWDEITGLPGYGAAWGFCWKEGGYNQHDSELFTWHNTTANYIGIGLDFIGPFAKENIVRAGVNSLSGIGYPVEEYGWKYRGSPQNWNTWLMWDDKGANGWLSQGPNTGDTGDTLFNIENPPFGQPSVAVTITTGENERLDPGSTTNQARWGLGFTVKDSDDVYFHACVYTDGVQSPRVLYQSSQKSSCTAISGTSVHTSILDFDSYPNGIRTITVDDDIPGEACCFYAWKGTTLQRWKPHIYRWVIYRGGPGTPPEPFARPIIVRGTSISRGAGSRDTRRNPNPNSTSTSAGTAGGLGPTPPRVVNVPPPILDLDILKTTVVSVGTSRGAGPTSPRQALIRSGSTSTSGTLRRSGATPPTVVFEPPPILDLDTLRTVVVSVGTSRAAGPASPRQSSTHSGGMMRRSGATPPTIVLDPPPVLELDILRLSLTAVSASRAAGLSPRQSLSTVGKMLGASGLTPPQVVNPKLPPGGYLWLGPRQRLTEPGGRNTRVRYQQNPRWLYPTVVFRPFVPRSRGGLGISQARSWRELNLRRPLTQMGRVDPPTVITFPARGTLAHDASTAIPESTTSSTTAHTAVGTPQALIVSVYSSTSTDHITGVTANGIPMNRERFVNVGGETGAVWIYSLYGTIPGGLPTGTFNVVVTSNTGNSYAGGITTLTSTTHAETDAIGSVSSGGAGVPYFDVPINVTSGVDAWIGGAAYCMGNDFASLTKPADSTTIGEADFGFEDGEAARKTALLVGGGAYNWSWTMSSNFGYAAIGIAVRATYD